MSQELVAQSSPLKGVTVEVIKPDQLDPVKDQSIGKLVYTMRGMYIVDASTIWPERDDVAGVQVAMGEMYCHGGWHATRTSQIIRIDRENGLIETRNSIYRSLDGRLA